VSLSSRNEAQFLGLSQSSGRLVSVPTMKPISPAQRKKILVLDLDETLVHSTSKFYAGNTNATVGECHNGISCDLVVEVLIDYMFCRFLVYKRPFLDLFLRTVMEWYELVIFTASLKQYANPVIDFLDKRKVVKRRLFRESCIFKGSGYVKDLSKVPALFAGAKSDPVDMSQVVIIDNSPLAYSMHKENAIPISDWLGHESTPLDEALLEVLPFLNALRHTHDVRSILSLKNLAQ